jgi:hypothetical protein
MPTTERPNEATTIDAEAPKERAGLPILITSPLESEDRPPSLANLVNVESGQDSMVVDLFYMAPSKISRILNSKDPVGDGYGVTVQDVIRVPSEPVARVGLSMHTAAELIGQLYHAIAAGSPGLRGELFARINSRVSSINQMVGWAPRPDGQEAGPGEDEA